MRGNDSCLKCFGYSATEACAKRTTTFGGLICVCGSALVPGAPAPPGLQNNESGAGWRAGGRYDGLLRRVWGEAGVTGPPMLGVGVTLNVEKLVGLACAGRSRHLGPSLRLSQVPPSPHKHKDALFYCTAPYLPVLHEDPKKPSHAKGLGNVPYHTMTYRTTPYRTMPYHTIPSPKEHNVRLRDVT